MQPSSDRPSAHTELSNLLARYMRAIDDRDPDAYSACLTDDIVVEHPAIGRAEGRAQVVAAASRVMDSLLTSQHLIGNIETEVEPPDAARAWFEIQAMHQFKGEPGAPLRAAGAAYCVDARNEAGRWRLARVHVRARWIDAGLAAFMAEFAARGAQG